MMGIGQPEKPSVESVIENWRSHTVIEICSAAIRASEEGTRRLIPHLFELLDHDDPVVREEALSTLLLGFSEGSAYDRGVGFLDDPTMEAVSRILARYVESDAPDRYSELMQMLIGRLIETANPDQQRAHYSGILVLLRIGEPERFEYLPGDFSLDRDVDWDLLSTWVPEAFQTPTRFRGRRTVSTEADLGLLRDESLPVVERVAAMRRLLIDHRHEARTTIQRLARDAVPELQVAALSGYVEAWGTIEAHLAATCLESPVEEVQEAAADALAQYGRNLGDVPSIVTAYLKKALKKDLPASAKRHAYRALLEVIRAESADVPDPFDAERDIDWGLLDEAIPTRGRKS